MSRPTQWKLTSAIVLGHGSALPFAAPATAQNVAALFASLGAAEQRWYSAQASFVAGTRTVPVELYETTGGVFDTPTPTGQKTVAVGSGTLAFQSCSEATFTYDFSGGSNKGQSGTIALHRVGPVPPGCTQ